MNIKFFNIKSTMKSSGSFGQHVKEYSVYERAKGPYLEVDRNYPFPFFNL